MGSNYDCFRLRKDYRNIACEPCVKGGKPQPPFAPAPHSCEDKFALDIARAIGSLLQCMACAPKRCCEGGISVKLVDECTRVPLAGIRVGLLANGAVIGETMTCERGLARFNGLCNGRYAIAVPGFNEAESVELTPACPYIMFVITVPCSCDCR